MKNLYPILASVMTILMTSCGRSSDKKEQDPATVKIESVQACDLDQNLQYPGKVVSANNADISFKVAGTLRRVLVKEGDHVSAGQLIAELDDTDYKVQLSATKAEYAQIKADAERVMALYKDGGTTASNYDKARYGLQQIEAKLKNHTNQLAYTKIYAPFDGYVKTKFFDSNETVGAGMPVVSIMGNGAPEIEVNLPAASYVHRAQFCNYSCTLDVLPGEVIPLQLVNVDHQANSNQLYTMRLRMAHTDSHIAPGMSAWVTIGSCGNESAQVSVPTTALLDKGGKQYVFLYNEKTKRIKQTEVSVLKLHTDGTAVVMGALRIGNQIVSTGVHYLKDGDQVKELTPVSSTNVGGLL